MLHFSLFVPTQSNVKLDNGNTSHAQGVGVILCCFTNLPIIYRVGTIYYSLGHPSNTISLGPIKFYVGFQKVVSEPLEHCDFFTLNIALGYHPTRLGTV